MSLGKLTRCVGRKGNQTAVCLFRGQIRQPLPFKVGLDGFPLSRCLHIDSNSSFYFLKPHVPLCFSCRRSLFGSSNDAELDKDSGLPLTHPTKGTLVYYGRLSSYTKRVKMFSLSTSVIALFAQPLILSAAKDDLIFKAGLLATMSTCLFATPAVVHFVTKKYVTDIYYNDETRVFTLATRSLFLRRKELEYKADDVEFPFVPRAFVSHIIQGKSFFIEESEFRGKEIYKHMVGFDKPFELVKGQNKKKKFGLFEDEKDNKVTPKPGSYIPTQIAFYDDDDDDIFKQQQQQQQLKDKQKNQVGSK